MINSRIQTAVHPTTARLQKLQVKLFAFLMLATSIPVTAKLPGLHCIVNMHLASSPISPIFSMHARKEGEPGI